MIHAVQRQYVCLAVLALACGLSGRPAMAQPGPDAAPQALEMSLEDLLDTQVVSVSKRPQSLADAASAVFVISGRELRRSGVTNIPDALRMVPGLTVARIDANKWAVGSRGFNGRFANKLLVLVDGRTIYTPSFSGVYWEMQDVMLEDVERIEVIRGPGATLWGANAVNGVINIITRHAADTQGGTVVLGGGSEERGFAAARYGAHLGEGSYGRLYAKTFKRDGFVFPDGRATGDQWEAVRAGFRVDSLLTDRDNLTLQGEIHGGEIDQTLQLATLEPPYSTIRGDTAEVGGGHLIARWERALSPVSRWTLQVYYDRFDRDEGFLRERRDTFDLDLTHRLQVGGDHHIVWGLGYRHSRDDFRNTPVVQAFPDSRSDNLASAFLQDEVTLLPEQLWLTLGAKLEHNDYTGLEVQPSARLAWTLDPANKLWASVSRAVRTPSRAEHDFSIRSVVVPPHSAFNPLSVPLASVATGNRRMESEKLIAYEAGYRVAPARNLTLDLALFYNDYRDLRSFVAATPEFAGDPPHLVWPALFANGVEGSSHGAELAAAWQAGSRVRFDLAYSYTETDVEWTSSADMAQNTAAPRHQVSLRTAMDLDAHLDLDLWLRYVDRTRVYSSQLSAGSIVIDDYLTLDLRLAWRPVPDLELSLVGQNLLDGCHAEYIAESFTLPTEVQRGVYGRLQLDF